MNDIIKKFNTPTDIKFNPQSKLFSILGNLAFDLGDDKKNIKRKYRIIGSIYGNCFSLNQKILYHF